MTVIAQSKQWVIFVGLFLVSLFFHTYNLEYASYDLDEAAHIWHAQKDFSDVVEQASQDPNPPVYNLFLSGWVKAFGVSEFSTRFLSVLFGALGVGLMFLVGSRNFGMAVGIMAALFYCFSPIQFRFTHLARPYSILMVTVLLSYGSLLEALKKPDKRKLFWYYLATTIMIYVHPTSVFNVAAQGLIILWNKRSDFKQIILLTVPLVGAVLSFGVWVVSIPYFERNDTMWFDAPNWEAIKYVLLVFYANGKLLILQLILLVVTLTLIVKSKKWDSLHQFGWLIIWCCVPFILSISFSHLVKPIFQDKYILSVQPAMMLLLAYSIYQMRSKLFQLSGFVLAGIMMFTSIDLTNNPEGDWRSAIEYLKKEQQNNESAILLDPWYEFRTFSYYYDRDSYETPDSTFKSLVMQNVFTSWHDVYDTLKLEPKFDLFHSVIAHEDFNSQARDERVLEKSATLVEEREYIGISIETYALHKKVFGNNEFSTSKVLRLADFDSASTLSIVVEVDIMQHQTLEGVLLITSVENKLGESILYSSKPVVEGDFEDEALHVKQEFKLAEFRRDWIVKTYLRNTEQCSFQYKSLAIHAN